MYIYVHVNIYVKVLLAISLSPTLQLVLRRKRARKTKSFSKKNFKPSKTQNSSFQRCSFCLFFCFNFWSNQSASFVFFFGNLVQALLDKRAFWSSGEISWFGETDIKKENRRNLKEFLLKRLFNKSFVSSVNKTFFFGSTVKIKHDHDQLIKEKIRQCWFVS